MSVAIEHFRYCRVKTFGDRFGTGCVLRAWRRPLDDGRLDGDEAPLALLPAELVRALLRQQLAPAAARSQHVSGRSTLVPQPGGPERMPAAAHGVHA